MKTLFGRAFVGRTFQDNTLVALDDDLIAEVRQTAHPPADAEKVEGVIVPGFIDTHVHGGAGADFMDGGDESNARIVSLHAQHGTTALAATTLSGTRAHIVQAIQGIVRTARHRPRGAEVCAIHLEGPYINPDRAGAQDAASIRAGDIEEAAELLGLAPHLKWIITLAPEIDGAQALIERFKDRAQFSIGHTAATFADAVAALEWGATHFTHLFNAMPGLHHREPGVVGAALISPDATAELIADDVHVHRAVLHLAAMAMRNRVTLITDAMRACGMPDGTYKLYEHDVTVAEGAARLRDGTLAGSVLTMDRAVRNMVELAGLPIEAVLPMATSVPARILGVADRKGKLEAGYDADVVVMTSRLDIERVFARGDEMTPSA
jgi:N-acetylglucosamine-6-phosphate deacetylase